MLHLRILAPTKLTDDVVHVLNEDPCVSGLAVVKDAAIRPAGDLVLADIPREAARLSPPPRRWAWVSINHGARRELFYTAVTRTKKRTRVVGSEESVRAAVQHRAVRAGGLRQRLRPALRR